MVNDCCILKPALLFNVKLPTLPVKVDAGNVCSEEPPKTTDAEALLASMLPDVRLMDPFRVIVLAPTVKVPEDNVSVPFTVGEVPIVKLPLVVKLLKVVAFPPIVPDPLNATVPVCALNVPLFVKVPPLAIVITLLPALITDVEAIVNSDTLGEESKFTVTPVGTETTAEFEFGTPPHQLPAKFQAPVEPPIHVPLLFKVTETVVLDELSQPETVCDA